MNIENCNYFPADPYDFKPKGLVRNEIVNIGSGLNGGIIKWEIPYTKISIFEWNEDYKYGSHYHVMLPSFKNKHKIPIHYRSGDMIPEPWNSIFW